MGAPLAGRQKKKILIVERWGKYFLEEYDRIKCPAIFYKIYNVLLYTVFG